MQLEVVRDRGSLRRTREAIETGRLTVGFLGGSITDPRPGFNWPEGVIAWLVETYPGVRIGVENAAIGATGSDSAVFRVDRDIIERKCDLVFVEYAVNDSGADPVVRGRTREGLLRKLIAAGIDVAIVYTFSGDMFAAMDAGNIPDTIRDFEILAEHYNLPSVWMGLHALTQVRAGLMRWHEWLPDNLHPQFRGSQVYADAVNGYLAGALAAGSDVGKNPMPAPVDPLNWETAKLIAPEDLTLTGPWTVRRWAPYVWIDRSVETTAPGAAIAGQFEGRVLWLGVDFGKRCADFRFRIDGGDWQAPVIDHPDWSGDTGWLRGFLLDHNLAPGAHRFDIETTFNAANGCASTDFKVGLIGFVPGR